MAGEQARDAVANFMTVTGCEDTIARFYLEASGWNLEMAVAQFLEEGAASSSTGLKHLESPQASASRHEPENEIRAPDSVKQQRLFEDFDDDKDEGGSMMLSAQQLGQPQVAARPGAFADYRTTMQGEAEVESGGDTLARLFAMPTKLMHSGDFQTARRDARKQLKWLLICIVDESDFASVAMNRDCWADETVQAIVESQFVLWLRPHLDHEAVVYADRYDRDRTTPASPRDDKPSSMRQQLFRVHPKHPHLGIVDPRTGRRLWMREGGLEASRLVESLSDICDRHSMNDEPRRPEPRPPREVKPKRSPPPKISDKPPWDSARVGPEPKTDGVLVQFRLVDRPTGAPITRKRRFAETETVAALFKFAQQESTAGDAKFELRAGYPPRQLWPLNQQTLAQANLKNEAVQMKFNN